MGSPRRYTQPGDSVVVAGGGWGASTVVAARMTRFEGDVTTFEPSSKMVETFDRTIPVNRVARLVTVEHAAIGPVREENARYFGPADGERRSPSAIPECDVLELDCEGVELDILRTLDGGPRVSIVETHPHVGCPAPEVGAAFSEMGYAIVERGTAGVAGDLPV